MLKETTDLDVPQRARSARRIGADLYRTAAAISPATIEAASAAVSRLSTITHDGRLVAEGFADAMLAETRGPPDLPAGSRPDIRSFRHTEVVACLSWGE